MDKKDEIYEKALELFVADGYDKTPLSKIAKALGITKAGLYYYFSSKTDSIDLPKCSPFSPLSAEPATSFSSVLPN